MFCSVHEPEAWLFSDPEILPSGVRIALPAGMKEPEEINFDEPPGKLLEKLYLKHLNKKYKKTGDGSKLFRKLNPEAAYQKCPYLRIMLDEMLKLAHDAGL